MINNTWRVVVFFICALLASCVSEKGNMSLNASNEISGEILKSQSDDRQYESVLLNNGLKVLLVSDPNATKAAASLDVNVGSEDNPKDHQGLAHFLEHMLFLGTEKYPVSDEYQQFIASHGGRHNAYTAYQHTNYFFDIDADFLPEILDRFSGFFINPLLTKKYIDRERNAVNAEYHARITHEYRRGQAVLSELMNQDHPASLFSVGNSQTLGGDADILKKELTDFYNKWYYAENMRLVVLGKEPLEELKSLVSSKFSGVVSKKDSMKGESKNSLVPSMYSKDDLPIYAEINALADINNLTVRFLLPSDKPHKATDPLGYIGFVLGHEGKGSLYYYLKEKGWAEGLSAGKSFEDDTDAVFSISVQLTNAGVSNKDAVVAHVFQAIHHLQSEEQLSHRLFEEIKKIQELEFNYQQKQQPIHYVSFLSRAFHDVDATDVLRTNAMLEKFSPQLTQQFLQQMTLQNSVITFQSNAINGDKETHFFNTKYQIRQLPESVINSWKNSGVNSSITWPEKNPYLPENLSLVAQRQQVKRKIILPTKVSDENGIAVWKGAEADYGLPKGKVTFFVRGLNVEKNARNAVLMDLYVAMVQEQLNPLAYLGAMAGLSSGVSGDTDTIRLSISGFSDKQGVYAKQALGLLAGPELNKKQFALLKARYQRGLINFKLQPPHQQAFSLTSGVLDPYHVALREKQQQIDQVTVDDLARFIEQFSNSLQVTLLMAGNYAPEQVKHFKRLIRHEYGSALKQTLLPERAVLRAPEQGVMYREPFAQKDTLYSLFLQGKDGSHGEAAHFALLGSVIRGDFFDELRTEQQMGYVVYATEANIKGLPGVFLLVQSPKNSLESINAAVSEFLQSQVSRIANMPDEQWGKYQRSVMTRYTERSKNINELSGSWAREIASGRYQFSRRFDVADKAKGVTPKELSLFLQELINKNHSVTVSSDKSAQLLPQKPVINEAQLSLWQEQQKRVKMNDM